MLLWWVLACGGSAAPDLPAPWNDLGLPVGSGEVRSVDEEDLHIRYTGRAANRARLATTYQDVLEGHGFATVKEGGLPGGIALELDRAEESLQILLTGHTVVDVLITRR